MSRDMWSNQSCDGLLDQVSPMGTTLLEMYVIKGDTWVVTSIGGQLQLAQLSETEAYERWLHRLASGWKVGHQSHSWRNLLAAYEAQLKRRPHHG